MRMTLILPTTLIRTGTVGSFGYLLLMIAFLQTPACCGPPILPPLRDYTADHNKPDHSTNLPSTNNPNNPNNPGKGTLKRSRSEPSDSSLSALERTQQNENPTPLKRQRSADLQPDEDRLTSPDNPDNPSGHLIKRRDTSSDSPAGSPNKSKSESSLSSSPVVDKTKHVSAADSDDELRSLTVTSPPTPPLNTASVGELFIEFFRVFGGIGESESSELSVSDDVEPEEGKSKHEGSENMDLDINMKKNSNKKKKKKQIIFDNNTTGVCVLRGKGYSLSVSPSVSLSVSLWACVYVWDICIYVCVRTRMYMCQVGSVPRLIWTWSMCLTPSLSSSVTLIGRLTLISLVTLITLRFRQHQHRQAVTLITLIILITLTKRISVNKI